MTVARYTLAATLRATLILCGAAWSPHAARAGGADCPPAAIMVPVGADIQSVADRAGEGATLCLQGGMHRMQVIRPRRGQRFFGEPGTVLNGSRLLTNFRWDGTYWVAGGQSLVGMPQGQCASETPACNLPEAVFIDDVPLVRVLDRRELEPGRFYFDRANRALYLSDDPRARKVEAAEAVVAFDGTAADVLIADVVVEKYATAAEKGAIQARRGTRWTIRNCEARLNSGGGIGVGTATHVEGCDVHHNGQIGITGVGNAVLIDNSHIWANNTRGFDYRWEAGGVKVAASDGVVFRRNRVHDNGGPGLWCDINCRNVLYEGNTVERNQDSGIFHEISFNAIIRGNLVRHNGAANRPWFWGADILVAASQDVQVSGNTVVTSPGRCAIMLIDQSRRAKGGAAYKTRANLVRDNDVTFEGRGCVGGASDAAEGDENFTVIEDGDNDFDHDIYRIPQASEPFRFAWGHRSFDWDEIRRKGLEANGQLVRY